MEILHFVNGSSPKRLESLAAIPAKGVIWADFVRGEEDAQAWECWAEPLLGTPIEPQHVQDSLSESHPSFFDGTSGYDMLIFEGLGPRDDPIPLETRSAAFFMFDRVLVTVRAADNLSFDMVRQRLVDGRLKAPASPLLLTYIVLDTMVDRFLKIREPLDRRFTSMQDELLDPKSRMNDWRELLEGRREARKLEALSESQSEALDYWHRNSRFDWTPHDEVRFRDLNEHVNRVLAHAGGQERDIEAAVQLHFASMSHRTNRIVQTLTTMSAIFFPLTLITGIYGMNFQNMPELGWQYGYYAALGLLLVVGVGLLVYFKHRQLL